MTGPPETLVPILRKVTAGEDLSAAEAEEGFHLIMGGTVSPIQVAGLLCGLQAKGLCGAEIAGGVRALRRAMIPVDALERHVVDTCGTGGGAVTTFNISTAAALVAAAGGVPVAKHGNRSFTSRSGSADVLEALDVTIDLTPEQMSRVLEEVGIVFMLAPLLHPAMRHVGPVRQALGVTTIMNLLGPLTNPARARRQVVGVADAQLLPLVAEGLAQLGHDAALVVHGQPGMDEVSPCGPTRIAEVANGSVRTYEVTPESLGVDPVPSQALSGGGPAKNAEIIRSVLEGSEGGPRRTAVIVNAAAAFYVAGRASSLRDGVRAAEHAIDSGAALDRLHHLIQATRRK
ncbi:MAG: anthranilate phosphoribosyltransferase [Gemmatimonadota bacterium]|nr:anthranilate phosphoribosyltransferase [Gemmatimonadota bacterium]